MYVNKAKSQTTLSHILLVGMWEGPHTPRRYVGGSTYSSQVCGRVHILLVGMWEGVKGQQTSVGMWEGVKGQQTPRRYVGGCKRSTNFCRNPWRSVSFIFVQKVKMPFFCFVIQAMDIIVQFSNYKSTCTTKHYIVYL